jgi:hypothetical protein
VLAVEPIKIAGLRELQAALKSIDGESQKQLRGVLNQAADMVVTSARREIPARTGAAAGSLKVASSQREARVKFGSAKVPYAGWLDYGGKVGRKKSNVRPFVKGGRYVYPAYYAQQAAITELLSVSLNALVESKGLKVDE